MGADHDRELLARLRAREVSRNRSFELFNRPTARRTLRLHLLLQQLEHTLLGCLHRETVTVRLGKNGGDGGERPHVLEIEDAELKLRRRVFLSEEELALLHEEPDVARLLRASLRSPDRTG